MKVFFAILLAIAPAPAFADPSPLRVGLLVGEPISATIGLTLSERFMAHADLGPSTSKHQGAIAAADLVYTLPDVLGADRSGDHFLFWFGAGLRYSSGKNDEPARFGARIPAGTSFFISARSLELFVLIAPGVSFIPDPRASLDGGIGIRVAL